MKTKPAGHKHIDSRAKWTSQERTNSVGPDKPHFHEIDLTTMTQAEIDFLASKLKPPPTGTLPPAPTGLRAVVGDRKVTLNWNAL